jgi:hypothetical protein
MWKLKKLKWGTDKNEENISSLYENENLKRGDRQKRKKHVPMQKLKRLKDKKGGRKEKKSHPCMKMKISKGGTDKKENKNG